MFVSYSLTKSSKHVEQVHRVVDRLRKCGFHSFTFVYMSRRMSVGSHSDRYLLYFYFSHYKGKFCDIGIYQDLSHNI